MAKNVMSKKTSSSKPPAFKRLRLTLWAVLFAFAGWWLLQTDFASNLKEPLLRYVDNKDIATLESRFSLEQILQSHQQEILGSDKSDKRILKRTSILYYPYLLLDVKYTTADQSAREGVLLWGLNDGEIVLNTGSWEKTHGFKDCLDCNATRSNFKILQSLAKKQTGMSIEELKKETGMGKETLEPWIKDSLDKHLVIQKGNLYQLHFEQPRILVTPQTDFKHPIVLKDQGSSQKGSRVYSRSQIVRLTKAAFGDDFKIRSEEEIYLPVYRLEVVNPDKSIHISEWNALTGQRIAPNYLRIR